MGFVAPEIAGPMIAENLQTALDLDPDFASSHYAQALIAVWMEWNWEKGEKEFLKALELNPNDAMSRIYYSHLLMILQNKEEALSMGQQAVDLDPLNPLILGLYAVVLSYGDQWEEAHAHAEKAIAIDPFNYLANVALEPVSYQIGDKKGLLKSARFCLPFEEEDFISIEKISEEEGIEAAYKEIVSQLEVLMQSGFILPMHMAARYSHLNQYDKALNQLELGFEVHDQNMPYMACGYGKMDSLYTNPRFLAIMEELNLPMPVE
jgi:tetratricopeptide (TPR) repeat protein